MIKVILPSSFDFEVPVVRLMDVHSRGVDRAWMQKRGAILTNEIGRIRPEPGHSYLHLIALGAMESYGTNRNGDSFNKQACEYNLPEPKKGIPVTIKLASGLLGHYQTFLQGHCFKHHQNKDPERKIGDVKEAAFNPDMNRVELIIRVPHNNEWNADLEKLANGKDIPFSMACKVAYDICSICGNRATNRGEYCDHLSNHMTEITKTGHQVTAINDVPNFFDISKVIRPADRIAWSLQKVAAIDCLTEPVGGARLAEMLGVSAPDAVLYQGSPAIAQKVASARKLAAIEKLIEGVARGEDNAHVRKLMSGCPHEQVPADDMEKLRSVQLGTALQGLASAQICLSVRDFLRLVAGDESASGGADMVEDALPGMYNRLLQNGGIEECAADSAYDPADTAIPRQIKEVLGKLAGGHSLADGPLQGRVHVTIIKGFMPGLPKRASYDSVAVSPEIQKVAKEYAKYQLSFLEAVGTNPLSTGLTVVRNYIRVC
jgi:hypothetical protein